MRWITLSLVALGLVALFVVLPGSVEVTAGEEAVVDEVAPATAPSDGTQNLDQMLQEGAEAAPGDPALGVPDPVSLTCDITASCSGGGSVMCSDPGTDCSSGTESCTTGDGCSGTRNFVQCGTTKNVCPCVKDDPSCPPQCPDPNCPAGQTCRSNSQCGPCGACVGGTCVCIAKTT